jgi:ribonuclease P protein component
MKANEKNLPTKQYSPQTHARISVTHEHSGRSRSDQKTPGQGPQTSMRPDTTKTGTALGKRPAPYTLPKAARILVRREFLALQRKGKRRHTAHFVVITAKTHTEQSRLGITATRRFGNAVMRNWMKRRLREFFRLHQANLIPAQNVLIIPKAGAGTLTFHKITQELERALSLAKKNV